MERKLDATDRKILQVMQDDASLSIDAISDMMGLSKNAIWRRIRQLESCGVITKQVALVNPEAIGLETMAIVLIKTPDHSPDWVRRFNEAIRELPNVQCAYRMTGDLDYMLKVRVRGIKDYDRFYRKLVSLIELADVSTSFVMEEIVETTALPLFETE